MKLMGKIRSICSFGCLALGLLLLRRKAQ